MPYYLQFGGQYKSNIDMKLFDTSYDIVVIGTEGVGKTILNKRIRGLEYDKKRDDQGTSTRKRLPSALLSIGNKKIKIKQGWDYGGAEDLRYNYNGLIKRRKIIILLFNTEKYMNDTEERDHLLGRIVGLMRRRVDLKDVYIMGSYYDKVSDRYSKNDIKKHLIEDIKKENDQTMIDDDHIRIMSFGYDNMNGEFIPDDSDIENFKVKLFNKN